jgi:hypothetical protein
VELQLSLERQTMEVHPRFKALEEHNLQEVQQVPQVPTEQERRVQEDRVDLL